MIGSFIADGATHGGKGSGMQLQFMESDFQTLPDLLISAALRDPDRLAIVEPGVSSLTYREFDSWSNQVARAFVERGARQGDRAAFVMGEHAKYLVATAGALKAGMAVVPVSWRLTPREMENIFSDCEPVFVVCDGEFCFAVTEALHRCNSDAVVVQLGGNISPGVIEFDGFGRSLDESIINLAQSTFAAFLAYTSGTTGKPKGAVFEHGTCRATTAMSALGFGITLGGVNIQCGSMSIAGIMLNQLWTFIGVSGTNVLVGRYDTQRIVKLLDEFAGTFTYIPAPKVLEVARLLRSNPRALRSLTSLMTGGTPILPKVLEECVAILGDRLVVGYAMTEAMGCGAIVIGRKRDWVENEPPFTAVGRAVPPTVVRVIDGEGNVLPHDGETVGEIALRTPLVMREYFRNPEGTKAVMLNGWLRTGDLGAIGPNGEIFLKGRSKEVVISGGMNIYPAEIERTIADHPEVAEVAVVGVTDEKWGEAPVAIIVPNGPPNENLEESVLAWCRSNLAGYKQPKRVVVISELPRNTMNKVSKAELRTALQEGRI